jgi:hypothetical protein
MPSRYQLDMRLVLQSHLPLAFAKFEGVTWSLGSVADNDVHHGILLRQCVSFASVLKPAIRLASNA